MSTSSNIIKQKTFWQQYGSLILILGGIVIGVVHVISSKPYLMLSCTISENRGDCKRKIENPSHGRF